MTGLDIAVARNAVQALYDRLLRPHLPRRIGVYNGVAARWPRLLDQTDVADDHEEACINALRQHVAPGDDVVSIGGGLGVSAVYASRFIGTGGQVTVFEASDEVAARVRETVDLNETRAPIEVIAESVGPVIDSWGEVSGRSRPVTDVPAADVLEIDAEGAELDIVAELSPEEWPTVICETHGFLGAPTHIVRARLEESGYHVEQAGWENEQRDVAVLVATRASA